MRCIAAGNAVPPCIDVLGDDKGRVGPADGLAGTLNLLGAKRLAMGFCGPCTLGRTLADAGLAGDQGGLVRSLGALQGSIYRVDILAVHARNHIPARRLKTLGRVVDKPGRHSAVDGYSVVVIEHDELAELPGAGQRNGFLADAFHQASITQEHIGSMVHHGVAGPVEFVRQELLSERHAHRVCQTLAERPGGGFHARGFMHLWVTRSFAVQLAETLQFIQREFIAAQVQRRIQEHGRVAVGQHKAIAVGPMRVGGVVLQMARPERDGHFSHSHGRARVTRIGLLNGVHRQGAHGICQFGGGRSGRGGWHGHKLQ